MEHLPEDLVLEVFMKAPLATVEQLRFVNARWGRIYREIMRHPDLRQAFINAHYDLVRDEGEKTEYYIIRDTNIKQGPYVKYSDRAMTQPLVTGLLVKGREEGTWYILYPNGSIAYATPFLHGMKNGIERRYDARTGIEVFTPYVKGVKEGIEKAYRNGTLIYEHPYSNDKLEGLAKEYQASLDIEEMGGKLYSMIIKPYVNGKLEGKAQVYQEGKLLYEIPYREGYRLDRVGNIITDTPTPAIHSYRVKYVPRGLRSLVPRSPVPSIPSFLPADPTPELPYQLKTLQNLPLPSGPYPYLRDPEPLSFNYKISTDVTPASTPLPRLPPLVALPKINLTGFGR